MHCRQFVLGRMNGEKRTEGRGQRAESGHGDLGMTGGKLGMQGCDRNDAELDGDPEARRRSRHQPPQKQHGPTEESTVGGCGKGKKEGGKKKGCERDARTACWYGALWLGCDGVQWVLECALPYLT